MNSALAVIDKIALALVIIGAVNWGLVGVFRFDLVAWLFGGAAGVLSRIVYILVGISGVWSFSLCSSPTPPPEPNRDDKKPAGRRACRLVEKLCFLTSRL